MECRYGDWFFWGALAMFLGKRWSHLSDGWLVIIALGIAWYINEQERTSNA